MCVCVCVCVCVCACARETAVALSVVRRRPSLAPSDLCKVFACVRAPVRPPLRRALALFGRERVHAYRGWCSVWLQMYMYVHVCVCVYVHREI